MLPLGSRLTLEILLEELAAAGLEEAVLVVSPAKERLIRGRFGGGAAGLRVRYALQAEMRGLGDALLKAAPELDPLRPFVVALGDAVFREPVPGGALKRLLDASEQAEIALLVQRVPRELLSRYGVVRPIEETRGAPFLIDDIVEKPSPEAAPSDFAAAARYVVPGSLLETLKSTAPGLGGEIQLTDALRARLADEERGVAVPLCAGEMRHDIGSLATYYRAFVSFALAEPEQGPALRHFLEDEMKLRALGSEEKPLSAAVPADEVAVR